MVKNKCVNMGWGPPRTPKHVSGWFVGPLDSVGTGSEVEIFEKKIRIFFDLHRVPPVKMKKRKSHKKKGKATIA